MHFHFQLSPSPSHLIYSLEFSGFQALFKRVNIDSIRVGGDRIRRDVGDLGALSRAITLFGWVSPIVVDEELNLVAVIGGLRRLGRAGRSTWRSRWSRRGLPR